jgi:hypothetical protein
MNSESFWWSDFWNWGFSIPLFPGPSHHVSNGSQGDKRPPTRPGQAPRPKAKFLSQSTSRILDQDRPGLGSIRLCIAVGQWQTRRLADSQTPATLLASRFRYHPGLRCSVVALQSPSPPPPLPSPESAKQQLQFMSPRLELTPYHHLPLTCCFCHGLSLSPRLSSKLSPSCPRCPVLFMLHQTTFH